MRQDLLIGIDAGTSVIKAVAFDTAGQQMAVATRPNLYHTLDNGGVEQDMRRTWSDAAEVVAELSEKIENLADRAVALSVTGQGDGTWLVDADGEPVHDGWLWLDARAATEAQQIAESDGIDEIYRQTGTGVNVCQMRTHLRWMQRHAPELLDQAETAFHCKDWLYFCLTGVRAGDPSESVFTFGDFRVRDYSDVVIEAMGLGGVRRLLPPIVDGSKDSHPLTASAARTTGLPQGLPVILGYVDVACSALGAGIYDPEIRPGLTILGSTGMHIIRVPSADAVKLNAERSGYTMTFPSSSYLQIQTNMVATINLDWWLELGCDLLASQGISRTRRDLLDGLDEQVLATKPRSLLFHPYISHAGERGPFTEPVARASFTGLDQKVRWIDMARSIYDGLALATRDCYTAMGPIPPEIRLTGGAARSLAMKKILADALGVPVRGVDQAEAGAAGAVMLAAVQQGIYPDIASCSEAWLTPRLQDSLPPDASLTASYNHLFKAYIDTRQAMPAIWRTQAQMRAALP